MLVSLSHCKCVLSSRPLYYQDSALTLVGSTQVEGTPGTECSLEIQQVSGCQVSLAGIPKVNSKLFGFVEYWFI